MAERLARKPTLPAMEPQFQDACPWALRPWPMLHLSTRSPAPTALPALGSPGGPHGSLGLRYEDAPPDCSGAHGHERHPKSIWEQRNQHFASQEGPPLFLSRSPKHLRLSVPSKAVRRRRTGTYTETRADSQGKVSHVPGLVQWQRLGVSLWWHAAGGPAGILRPHPAQDPCLQVRATVYMENTRALRAEKAWTSR